MDSRKKILIFSSIGVFTLLILCGLFFNQVLKSETREYSFENYEQAEEQVAQGWFPSNLPEALTKNAQNIHITYNLDSNNVWVRFEAPFDPEDFEAELIDDAKDNEEIYVSPLTREWWPEYLNDKESLTKQPDLDIYKYNYREVSKHKYFVVDRSEKIVYIYYWSVINPESGE